MTDEQEITELRAEVVRLREENAMLRGRRERVMADGVAWALPAPRRAGLIDGAAERRHGQHVWCADRDGLCIPRFLHSEFIGKLGTDDAHNQLLAWYPQNLALFANRAIGEDGFVFWRNSFGLWVGAATTRTVGSVQAVRRQRW